MGSPARPSLHRIRRWTAALALSVVGSGYGPAAAQPAPEPVTCESDPLCNNRVERAEISAQEGNLKGAILLYKLAYSERPDPRLLYYLGMMYRRQGQFTEARDTYKEFLSKPGQDEESRRKAQAFLIEREREDLRLSPSLTGPSPPPKPGLGKALLITGGIFLGFGIAQAVVGGAFMGTWGRKGPEGILYGGAILTHGTIAVLIGLPLVVVGRKRHAEATPPEVP